MTIEQLEAQPWIDGAFRLILLCFIVSLVFCAWAGLPVDAVEAHRYADAVLYPRFSAALNDFAYHHPQDNKPGSWSHVQEIDVKDRKRWRAVRESWDELEAAMRRAGF
jgi:hypothetical protein